ncbi:hypothetical protein [Euzebyella saccharophila]|uniref:Uncharacterized protein n=1 Tax=Euzebyella saccharophila TaxID=679664 RepID=A0ABV8JUT9_9FLAO|nr:hypothetical protein [Euzebyella saccharophila]
MEINELLREWRTCKPVLEIDIYGRECFQFPCRIIKVEKRTDLLFGAADEIFVEFECLNFENGELDLREGIMYNKTYERFKSLGEQLPNNTFAKFIATKNEGLKTVIYKTGSFMPRIMFLEMMGSEAGATRFSKDGMVEFHNNYSELRNWIAERSSAAIENKTDNFSDNSYLNDDSCYNSDGWDYYNDQLDMDQQGPEFWDNI